MRRKLKKIIPLIAITLISLFALIGCPGITIDLTPTMHNCAYGFDSKGLKSTNGVHDLITESDNWTTSATKENPRVYYYHLSTNCNYNKPVTLGDYVYVGICLYKSTLSGIEENVVTNSTNGIFVYDCTRHGCYHNQAEAITVSKSILDFSVVIAKIKGTDCKIKSGYYCVDGSVDFIGYLEDKSISFENPQNTYVCYNNKMPEGSDANIEALKKLGANVTVDCVEDKNIYEKVHDCAYENMLSSVSPKAIPIGQTEVDYVLSGNGEMELPTFSRYYLTEDVYFEGEIALPPEYLTVICLNGYSFNVNYSGNVFLLNCESHVCVNSNNEKHIPLSQEILEFASCAGRFLSAEKVVFPSGNYALVENVDLTGLNVGFDSVSDYIVCGNGFSVLGDIEITENVRLQDCTLSLDSHSHEGISPHITAVKLTSNNVRNYFDSNGVLLNKNKEHAFFLDEDVFVEKSLVIPSGSTVSLCLNGFTLYTYGISYENISTVRVCYNARFKIFDCSKEATGNIVLKMENENEEESQSTESSQNQSGLDFSNMRMSAVCNLGLTELYSGNLYGMNGVYNLGEFIMYGGTANGIVSGVYQDYPDEDDFPLTATDIQCEILSSEVGGALLGACIGYGVGEITNCTISATLMGIVSGTTLTSGSSIGGELVIGDVVLNLTDDHVYDIAIKVFENSEEYNESLEGINNEVFCAIQSMGDVTFTGDFVCNIDPEFLESYVSNDQVVNPEKVDLVIGKNVNVEIEEGVEFTRKLSLYVEPSEDSTEVIISHSNVSGVFTPIDGESLVLKASGETVMLSGDEARFLNNAKVEASLDGQNPFNTTLTFTYDKESDLASFLNATNSKVIITDNESGESLSLEPKNTDVFQEVSDKVYLLNIPIDPKSYQRSFTVEFSNGEFLWTGVNDVSIEKLLLDAIEDTNRYLSVNTYDSGEKGEYAEIVAVRDYAIATLNYCQNTAVMFGTSNGFESCEEEFSVNVTVSEAMNMVTATELEPFKKADVSGAPINGVQIAGTSIILNYNIDLRLYIMLSDSIALNELSLTVDGAPVNIMPYEGVKNGYYVEISGIRAYELVNNFTFKFTYGEEYYEFSYGVLSYVYTTIKNGNPDDLATINCKAISLYAMFAQIYNDVLIQNAEMGV